MAGLLRRAGAALVAPLVLLAPALAAGAEAALEAGAKAPPFELVGAKGAVHRLDDHLGQRGVVLAWFPKAFTPGCTKELESLRDSEAAINAFEVAWFMVSLDSPERNAEFARSLSGNFPVVSDPSKLTAEAYGVLGSGGSAARRWTFYIDSEGIIRKVDRDVRPETAGADLARTLAELGFPRRESAAAR